MPDPTPTDKHRLVSAYDDEHVLDRYHGGAENLEDEFGPCDNDGGW